MKYNVVALERLTVTDNPPERLLRPNKRGSWARYYFADASGAGYGRSGWTPGDVAIEIDYGSWGDRIATTTSSNFRELGNIVKKIEDLDQQGSLTDLAGVFVFLVACYSHERTGFRAY
ncbi:hypothetical protein ACA910_009862 [Epithemia clementina (nom. ined.)]